MFSGCVNLLNEDGTAERSSTAIPSTTRAVDPLFSKVFTAEVVRVTNQGIHVKTQHRSLMVMLANTASRGSCPVELGDVTGRRIAELLPVGSSITVVWAASPQPSPTAAYVYLAEPGKPSSETPYGASINEQLIAEGNATLPIDRSITAAPIEQQIVTLRASVTVPETLPTFELLVATDAAAWENRAGLIDICRTRIESEDNRNRELYGPDGRSGTSDDPYRAKPDRTGNGSGNAGGSGGGNGREGRFCRKHWWC